MFTCMFLHVLACLLHPFAYVLDAALMSEYTILYPDELLSLHYCCGISESIVLSIVLALSIVLGIVPMGRKPHPGERNKR
jgi:hypothetical protein